MTIAQNRLASETSPYLLQHASNPVDWYPWGSEALNRAQEENKPIFLSIGYSTCHWCHVMERESFEDEEVARILNRDFIPVKVDREQRPDLDAIYMAACQAFTGRGGWPLTVFLTPDGTPFFAASYLPKVGRPGQVGLIELLTETARMWREEPERLRGAARQVQSTLMNRSSGKFEGSRAGAVIPDAAVNMLKRAFDPKYGGFGGAPKFPTPHDLLLLMDHYTRTNDAESLSMAERTLTHMYRGGLFDHIGGGF
ncbi:MAG: thioredoxin domain-containing protein, partial [Clostridia bacterium]|nr:thioredoxin domain-containing protein [Clostridia bacterium]